MRLKLARRTRDCPNTEVNHIEENIQKSEIYVEECSFNLQKLKKIRQVRNQIAQTTRET